MKIWIREVYDKELLSYCLNETFLRVLNNHRDKFVKDTAGNNLSCSSGNEVDAEQVPKILFLNLKTMPK